MSPRLSQTLPYGEGLDRATGVTVIERSKFSDLRNVILVDGKAEARKGHLETGRLVDNAAAELNAVIGIHALRSLQQGLGVGYKTSDRTVHVNRLTGAGALAQYIDDWFTADDESATPRIVLADQYNKVFMAHDEPIYSRRAMTAYFEDDALFGLGPLNPDGSPNGNVESDLDGDSTNDQIKFRGVVNHLKYLVGWGYGTATDPDRSEIVRVCHPGEPLRWRGDDYFIAGARGVPVVGCGSAGKTLMVLKENEAHRIFGYDRSTFGIDIADPFRGLAGARLLASVGDTLFGWSSQGPWATSGGPLVDIGGVLDLDAPEPADLVESGDVADGFASYLPDKKVLLFIFGARVYCLSLRNPSLPKWSYWELGEPVFCGGIIYSGGVTGSGTAPSAYVSGLAGTAGP